MVGLILRHQLLLLLEQHAFVKANLSSIKDSGDWSSLYFENFTPKQLKLLEDSMRAYHFCHHPHRRDLTSRPEAVDEPDLNSRVVGMITRKNLSLASKRSIVHDPRRINSILQWDSESTVDERRNKNFLYSLP